MTTQETKKDWTTAEGTRIETFYTAPPGYRIEKIIGDEESSAHYVDTDHNEDRHGGGPGGPVKEFVFRGDRKGDDAGSYTGVDVYFNPLVMKLVEVANCAPESSIKSMQKKGLIDSVTIERLRPMMMKSCVGCDELTNPGKFLGSVMLGFLLLPQPAVLRTT